MTVYLIEDNKAIEKFENVTKFTKHFIFYKQGDNLRFKFAFKNNRYFSTNEKGD